MKTPGWGTRTKGAALASSFGVWSFSSDVRHALAMGFSPRERNVLGFFSDSYGVLDSPFRPRGTDLACKLTRENSLPHLGHAKNEKRARHCRRRANHPNQGKHQPRAGSIAILKLPQDHSVESSQACRPLEGNSPERRHQRQTRGHGIKSKRMNLMLLRHKLRPVSRFRTIWLTHALMIDSRRRFLHRLCRAAVP